MILRATIKAYMEIITNRCKGAIYGRSRLWYQIDAVLGAGFRLALSYPGQEWLVGAATRKTPCQLRDFHLNLGDAILLQGVKITKSNPYGQVNLALARDPIVVNFGTSLVTNRLATNIPRVWRAFWYWVRILDEKSNGFQLEQSLVRSPIALSRLCLVLAIATLF